MLNSNLIRTFFPRQITLIKIGVIAFLSLWLGLIFTPSSTAVEAFQVPKWSSPIVDKAHLLNIMTKQKLESAMIAINRDTGVQMAVLILPELYGSTIEQLSIKVVDEWKPGKKETDKGVLLLIALKERKMRIEVGQGLEGSLTDAYAKRIIDESMAPLFRANNPSGAITIGLYEIAQYSNPNKDMKPYFNNASLSSSSRSKRQSRPMTPLEVIIFAGILLFMLFTRTGRSFLIFMLITGMGGGSSRRGGGFGGGGGGGFSGGGASGGW